MVAKNLSPRDKIRECSRILVGEIKAIIRLFFNGCEDTNKFYKVELVLELSF